MPSQKKKDTVADLSNDLSSYDAIAFTDYVGITHQQLEELRGDLRKSNGKIRVTKNALLTLALKEAGVAVEDTAISGPTAVVLANADDLSPFKTVHEKGNELDSLTIKGGVWEKQIVAADYIVRLSTLPSTDELRAQVVGSLQSPISRLVYGLKGNLQKLTMVLAQVHAQKQAAS